MNERASIHIWCKTTAILVIAVGVGATNAEAQIDVPDGRVVLFGVVLNQEGRPVQRAQVCAGPARPSMAFCVDVDSAGSYRTNEMATGEVRVVVTCWTHRDMWVTWPLEDDTISVAASALVRRDWRVSDEACDRRPLRRMSGDFRGHWTTGFESSRFSPCPADTWVLPGDSLGIYDPYLDTAWLTLPQEGPSSYGSLNRPLVREDPTGYPTYYVAVRGTVVGPGAYGHMSGSPFELVADSVLFLRAPSAEDCL